MKELKDYQTAKKTYFRLDSSYEGGEGWINREEAMMFHRDLPTLFKDAGWNVTDCYISGACPTVEKGLSSLYLHPMHFSGPCQDDHVDEVKNIISKMPYVSLRAVDTYDMVYHVDNEEDEMHLYHILNDGRITDMIKDVTETKRRNLYVNRFHAESTLRSRVAISTSLRSCGVYTSDDTGWKYVSAWLDKMIADGLVVTEEEGLLIRWANKR